MRNSKFLFLFIVVSFFTVITGCEDPGIIGQGFTDTNTTVEVDTFQVSGVESESYEYYTGSLSYLSAGQFVDPVFGDMKSIGLIRPLLVAEGTDISINASMKLRLAIDQQYVYGDSTDPAEFDLVELDQAWRGNAWRISDQPQFRNANPVGTFTVDRQDSIDVELSSNFLARYINYVSGNEDRDTYRTNFGGLAIVPKDSTKILPIQSQETSFIIENPEDDTLEFGLRDWAFSLERASQGAVPAETSKWHSTLENVIKLDLDIPEEELQAINISRVELVVYEDQMRLRNSMDQLSPTAGRPPISSARLFLLEPENVPVALESGNVLSNGVYNEDDGTYRFDITSFTNSVLISGIREELGFYLTLQTHNGIIRSSLLYNDEAPQAKQPKIIVTSVQNQESTD
ncbi:MAG: hypothetical protein U5K69_14970 [Balneolaceae bacterium]|nr:hypothetical protein [Balneolaceae bacterium]